MSGENTTRAESGQPQQAREYRANTTLVCRLGLAGGCGENTYSGGKDVDPDPLGYITTKHRSRLLL